MGHASDPMLRINCDSASCAVFSAEARGISTSYPSIKSGTTTMKMISSTSTTSTSGVMLISDCRLESLLLNCMMSLSFCAGALGDQPHAAEACLLDREHDLPDLEKIELCVASDYDPWIGLDAHRSVEGFAEMLRFDGPIVDPQPAGLVDGDQYSASLVALRVRFRRVRHVHVRPFPHLRRHHHEDDQQHQDHVNQRRDVDGRLHLARFTEPHKPALPF